MEDLSDLPLILLEGTSGQRIAPSPIPVHAWPVPTVKPPILIVDRAETPLDSPLAHEGFEVYRTRRAAEAVELVRAHAAISTVLVRMDLADVETATLIRDLSAERPGLWIGMRADLADRERIASGYAAGAADLIPLGEDPARTVDRLVRGLRAALQRREAAEQAVQPRVRRARRSSIRLSSALVISLILGVALAAITGWCLQAWDSFTSRIDRAVKALESAPPAPLPADRQLDRWYRAERFDLDRRVQDARRASQERALEEEHYRNLFRDFRPHYPER